MWLRELPWRVLAAIVSRPRVATWLIERSKRTPYYPITSRDGTEIYMDRHWLFNPYSKDENGNAGPARWGWPLPSIRVHHILRADDDGALHNHPWPARTIILREWYEEERPAKNGQRNIASRWVNGEGTRQILFRKTGYTGRVTVSDFHRISNVPSKGVVTLWFTWKYVRSWGFLVNGKVVPWRDYLANR